MNSIEWCAVFDTKRFCSLAFKFGVEGPPMVLTNATSESPRVINNKIWSEIWGFWFPITNVGFQILNYEKNVI